jgi:hypothetical protein
MEQKQSWRAPEHGAECRPPQANLRVVSGFAPEPTAAPESSAQLPAPPLPVERDRILAIFDWLCAGPVSDWEREVTRRAHWRLA